MTDKEVIKLAQGVIATFKCDSETMVDFCNTVIKKFEQQPSEDCISRQAVIEHICENKECYKEECKGRTLKRCYDLQWVFDLTSVTPQQPCEDCISRENTLNKINALIAEYIPLMPIGWTLPLNIAKTINELPTVTPQPCEKQSGTVQLHDPLIDEVVKSGAPFKKWLESFNTDSASVCFNKIQELKGIVGAESEKKYPGGL